MNTLSLKKLKNNIKSEKPTRFTEISIVGAKFNKKVNMPKKQNTLTEYQNQYKAKQQIKEFYGNISETTLKIIGEKASNSWFCEMEKRLDVILFRLGFARSIFEARYLIKGGFVKLNDKSIDNKSITKILNVGSKITVENTEVPYLAKIKHLKLNLLKMPTHLFTPNIKDLNLTSSTYKLEGYLIKEPIESEIFLPINYQINKLRKF